MKLLKKLSVLILCLTLIFVLSGCAKIQYQRVLNTNGSIVDAVSVKLDEQKIVENGFDIGNVKAEIRRKMNIYLNAICNAFETRNDRLNEIEKTAIRNNVLAEVIDSGEYITASLTFSNYSAFKYFYGLHLVNEDEQDNSETINTLLYNKNITTGKTIFSGEDAQFITNEFLSYFGNKFDINDAELIYIFATPGSRLHSDATYSYEIDGVHYHEWVVKDINQGIQTFTIQVKPINWYVLALLLTVVLLAVLFLIASIKRKKQVKMKKEIISINENAKDFKNDEKNFKK